MSDINFTLDFPWYSWPLILAIMGWPGLLFGAFLGGLIAAGLRGRHWIWGAVLGGIAGCLLWGSYKAWLT
jgi:hypothetical protein